MVLGRARSFHHQNPLHVDAAPLKDWHVLPELEAHHERDRQLETPAMNELPIYLTLFMRKHDAELSLRPTNITKVGYGWLAKLAWSTRDFPINQMEAIGNDPSRVLQDI